MGETPARLYRSILDDLSDGGDVSTAERDQEPDATYPAAEPAGDSPSAPTEAAASSPPEPTNANVGRAPGSRLRYRRAAPTDPEPSEGDQGGGLGLPNPGISADEGAGSAEPELQTPTGEAANGQGGISS
jgi:hypothetical protein